MRPAYTPSDSARTLALIYKTKKVRNAEWVLGKMKSGKFALYMNCSIQRIFSDYTEADSWFEIWTSK